MADALIPPSGKPEEEEDPKEVFERFRSEYSDEEEARKKTIEHLLERRRRMLSQITVPTRNYQRDMARLPGEEEEEDDEPDYRSDEELPKGYGLASYDPGSGSKDFVTKMKCGKCGSPCFTD